MYYAFELLIAWCLRINILIIFNECIFLVTYLPFGWFESKAILKTTIYIKPDKNQQAKNLTRMLPVKGDINLLTLLLHAF